ncbi:MAG: hypothetical protein GY797_05990 [Deltaproteobacteria bacterium]|nr:hypothetical protein [Deltaproteobacteria bacterium]
MKKRPLHEKPKRKEPAPILGVYPAGWIFIFFLILCFGFVAFIWVRDNGPPKVETITAEISDLWVEEIQGDDGGYRIYRIRLKQDNEEFICQLSSTIARQLHQFEAGKNYEFLVSKTPARCFITEAIILDEVKGD